MAPKVKRRTRTAAKRTRSARKRMLKAEGITIQMPSNPTVDGDAAADVLASYSTGTVGASAAQDWHAWAAETLRRALDRLHGSLPQGGRKDACKQNRDHIQRWD